MKYIYYHVNNPINIGTEEEPVWKNNLTPVRIKYTEANMVLAKKEAYGEPVIKDDGTEEPIPESTAEERIAALEEENAMLMECILEMSEIVYA